MYFVDSGLANDNIARDKLWSTLEEFGISKKLIHLIKEYNVQTVSKFKFGNGTSQNFEVKTGLKQSDALLPILFNLALTKVIRSMPMQQGMEILSNTANDDLGKLFRSKLFSRQSKECLKSNFIRLVLTYACEKWLVLKEGFTDLSWKMKFIEEETIGNCSQSTKTQVSMPSIEARAFDEDDMKLCVVTLDSGVNSIGFDSNIMEELSVTSA
ncbi:Reverse transcriptase domain [Cinara cedri]|uniref:Reverse transcriptase domain n=1 Tax=Cinara cedri TaxID=506608 RepID=A0A5E4M2M2_9HEMI|nr:Reverse transcriptase domain [Cinara cedri]